MSDQSNDRPQLQTIVGLFDAASSSAPTPGGGYVAAVVGYFGVSLLLKACRITAKRGGSSALQEIESTLTTIAPTFLALAESDSAAFKSYIDALQLPKSTEVEANKRREALATAAQDASAVSVSILESGVVTIDAGMKLRDIAAKGILPDVSGGVSFAESMCLVAVENFCANASSAQIDSALTGRFDSARGRLMALTSRL